MGACQYLTFQSFFFPSGGATILNIKFTFLGEIFTLLSIFVYIIYAKFNYRLLFFFFLLVGRIRVKLSAILKLKCHLNSWARKLSLSPFAASFITNRIFHESYFSICNLYKCIYKCRDNVYTMYTLCVYFLIFELDFFSLSLFLTDFL